MRILLLLIIAFIVDRSYSAPSPIIYGSVAGVRCAYNLISKTCVPSSASGVDTLAAIGASANANGATLASTTLNLEPASASFGGVVTTGAQTIAGVKTFNDNIITASGKMIGIGATPVRDFSISSTEPTLFWTQTGAAANNKGFQITQSGGILYMQFLNDALAGNSIMEVQRSGNTVTNVQFPQGQFIFGAGDGTATYTGSGAGAMSTDAGGIITTTSDERLKDIKGPFSRGLEALKVIKPIMYSWKAQVNGKSTKHDPSYVYAGFSAQNLEKGIPEAVSEGPEGWLSVQDRAVLAVLVNAINELDQTCVKKPGALAAIKNVIARPVRQKSKPMLPRKMFLSKKAS